LSATVTTGLAGFILVWTGFDVVKYGRTQPPETLERMLEWYVFLPMGFWVCALLLLRLYPLSPAKMTEIRLQLEARRGKV
jgi:Na+/melibiose symporter-like transporter